MNSELLSFIIPAYNEEKYIGKTISKIKEYVPSRYRYEIIVVDHGSTDKTEEIAIKMGAKVISRNDGTIASLRNCGANIANGDIFIFLDSDVSLTQQWGDNIAPVVQSLNEGARLLTGSWYTISEDPNWIEKYWFEPLQKINNTHINSGHMIISRSQFFELGGFDDKLETGEDYDISMRAKTLNIQVIDNHDLMVIHEGYPNGLWEFMLREYWHGKGDVLNIRSVLRSKVALLSFIFMLLHLMLLLILASMTGMQLAYACIFCIILICFISAFIKYRHETLKVLCVNTVLYYFYFTSRAATLLMRIINIGIQKRQR